TARRPDRVGNGGRGDGVHPVRTGSHGGTGWRRKRKPIPRIRTINLHERRLEGPPAQELAARLVGQGPLGSGEARRNAWALDLCPLPRQDGREVNPGAKGSQAHRPHGPGRACSCNSNNFVRTWNPSTPPVLSCKPGASAIANAAGATCP